LPDALWVFHRSVLDGPAAATLTARVRNRNQRTEIPNSQQGNLGLSGT
jgi:hypothetical protein